MTKHEKLIANRVRGMHARMAHLCIEKGHGLDTMRMIQIYAGITCELLLEYEQPCEAMCDFMASMQRHLGVCLHFHPLSKDCLPPVYVMDRDFEFGRSYIREVDLEEWDDVHTVLGTIKDLLVHDITVWEEARLDRGTSLNLFYESLKLAMSFENAAQDLCDIVIGDLIAEKDWSLSDCIMGLAAVAGQQISNYGLQEVQGGAYVDALDQLIFIMNQEAIRLGVPDGADWRMSMAANDQPVNPPFGLIAHVRPICLDYMNKISVHHQAHIAALIAKATGRMMAVAAGGELPEVEPAIAKPLAMTAISDSYYFEAQRIKTGS